KDDMRRGMVSGADDYLTKPFTPDELLEAVSSRLARHVELKCQVHKQAERLRDEVLHILSLEIGRPLDDILQTTSQLMDERALAQPEKVFEKVRKISESVRRVNQLARGLEA